jgi:hypothetical protein
VAAHFQKAAGAPLRDFGGDAAYDTQNGNVAVGARFTPACHRATYKALTLWMPVSELHCGPGHHALGACVVLSTGAEASGQLVRELARSEVLPFTYRIP